MLRVDDGRVWAFAGELAFVHCFDMRAPWTVAVLATYRRLRECRIAIGSIMGSNGLRTAAVAIDAAGLDDAVKAEVPVLIAGRKIPARGVRVIRKRRLEEIIATAQERT